ncbi:MAG: DUF2911 domain-containing protein [Saprospiraceae bacterium]|nr:DUF2911 domain-containing protein [Saprospiraceae bacterium]
MLQRLFCMVLLSLLSLGKTDAQLRIPSLSPSSTVRQDLGLTAIEIRYARPSARGRTIFGEKGLVRYHEFWRTGANAATKITIEQDIYLQDQMLMKGSYALLSKPSLTNWTLYFYPYESGNWNTYVDKTPTLMISAPSSTSMDFQESFSIYFDQLELGSAQLVFAWAKIRVHASIRVDFKDKVLQDIDKTMAGPSRNDYFQSALFLHEMGLDLELALEYIQEVTRKGEPPLFFQVHREALILADLNRNGEAVSVAQKALELSKEAGNKDFVRLCEQLIEKLKS